MVFMSLRIGGKFILRTLFPPTLRPGPPAPPATAAKKNSRPAQSWGADG
jgi:hypothetical protein